ncbi:MAG: hypothetical protein JWM53_6864 [bacterium]|nr:hypothetical protein [bacterium]
MAVGIAMTRSLVVVVVLVLLGGCAAHNYAIVDGKRVERPSVVYGGDYFWLEHDRAFPGVFDPKRGRDVDDGTLTGKLCGVDVSFDASWYRSRLHLDGHGQTGQQARSYVRSEGDFRLELEVTELGPGRRRITGVLPTTTNLESAIVDLDVSPGRLVGQIGTRQFTLAADGDYLAGRYERHGDIPRPIDETYAIFGRQMLGTMVPADEALVLVMMMTCSSTIEYAGKMLRGFSMVSLPPK